MVDPTHQVFWFASRAFGIVAMLLLGVSVAVGLAMSGRLAHRPGCRQSSSTFTSRPRW